MTSASRAFRAAFTAAIAVFATPVVGATEAERTATAKKAATLKSQAAPVALPAGVGPAKTAEGLPNNKGIGSQGGPPDLSGRIPKSEANDARKTASDKEQAEEMRQKLVKEKSRQSVDGRKEVGPDYFSREKQLKDLSNAGAGRGVDAPQPGTATGGFNKGLDDKAKWHGNTGSSSTTTVTPGLTTVPKDAGRNEVSKREQQSDKDGKQHPSGGPKGSDAAKAFAFGQKAFENFLKVDRTWHDNGVMRSQTVRNTTTGDAQRDWFSKDGKQERKETAIGKGAPPDPKKTPNPEAAARATPTKSPAEMQAERKRQVTLPSDEQGRATPPVRVSAETARAMGKGGNTSGNINPGPGDGTQGNAPGAKLTSGIEKVDGTTGGGGTGPSPTGQ